MSFPLLDQYRGLATSVYVLTLARFISALGQFIFPFLTMFLSSRMHLSDQQISYFLLVTYLAMIMAAPCGGRLADRFNRKYVYIILTLIGESFFIATGFLLEKPAAVALIICGYFFIYATGPILSALMMDLTPPHQRQESFSLVYLGFNLGYAFGPLIAGLLFIHHTAWLFWGQALMGMASLLLLALYIRDARPDRAALEAIAADPSRRREQASSASWLRQLLSDPRFLLFCLLTAMFAFSYSQMAYILPLDMARIFGVESGSRAYGLVWSVNAALVVALTPLVVLLSRRKPPLFNMIIAALCYTVGFGAYAWARQLWLIYALAVLWSLGEVYCFANASVFMAGHAPATHRARYQSVYEALNAAGRASGPLLMGRFLIGRAYNQGWLLAGAVCLLAAAGFLLMLLTENRAEARLEAKAAREA